MTQNDSILRLMRRRWITGIEALRECGCFRLAARVYELRDRGHKVERRWVERNGKRYAAYRITSA